MIDEDSAQPFSRRHGVSPSPPIRFTAELSDALRQPILDILRESVGTEPLMSSLKRLFNPYGITPPPERSGAIEHSEAERKAGFLPVKRVLLQCEWFHLYDVIEDVLGQLEFYETDLAPEDEEPRSPHLRRDLNAYFEHAGIGWQVRADRIVSRGSEAFESSVSAASDALLGAGRPTAAGHIRNALQALSARPQANTSGATYHAMGALEAVARDLVGKEKATLGEILKQHPELLPPPLDRALSQVWGYASNVARHVVEGRQPTREEAELVVGLAASVATYLTRKSPS